MEIEFTLEQIDRIHAESPLAAMMVVDSRDKDASGPAEEDDFEDRAAPGSPAEAAGRVADELWERLDNIDKVRWHFLRGASWSPACSPAGSPRWPRPGRPPCSACRAPPRPSSRPACSAHVQAGPQGQVPAGHARRHGVEIPEDINFRLVNQDTLPPGVLVEYAQLGKPTSAGEMISWERFYNQFEQIPVRLSRGVLNSDEAIVAVIGHEMHELNALRKLFDANDGYLRADQLYRAIAPGFKGNLHDQAWDVADKLVKGMRGGGGPAPQ